MLLETAPPIVSFHFGLPAADRIGGGVIVASALHAKIEQTTARWLADYVEIPAPYAGPFIEPPDPRDDASLIGGFALAQALL